MSTEQGYLGVFIEGLYSFISVNYPEIYSDLKDENKKELREIKEKFHNIFMEYLNQH